MRKVFMQQEIQLEVLEALISGDFSNVKEILKSATYYDSASIQDDVEKLFDLPNADKQNSGSKNDNAREKAKELISKMNGDDLKGIMTSFADLIAKSIANPEIKLDVKPVLDELDKIEKNPEARGTNMANKPYVNGEVYADGSQQTTLFKRTPQKGQAKKDETQTPDNVITLPLDNVPEEHRKKFVEGVKKLTETELSSDILSKIMLGDYESVVAIARENGVSIGAADTVNLYFGNQSQKRKSTPKTEAQKKEAKAKADALLKSMTKEEFKSFFEGLFSSFTQNTIDFDPIVTKLDEIEKKHESAIKAAVATLSSSVVNAGEQVTGAVGSVDKTVQAGTERLEKVLGEIRDKIPEIDYERLKGDMKVAFTDAVREFYSTASANGGSAKVGDINVHINLPDAIARAVSGQGTMSSDTSSQQTNPQGVVNNNTNTVTTGSGIDATLMQGFIDAINNLSKNNQQAAQSQQQTQTQQQSQSVSPDIALILKTQEAILKALETQGKLLEKALNNQNQNSNGSNGNTTINIDNKSDNSQQQQSGDQHQQGGDQQQQGGEQHQQGGSQQQGNTQKTEKSDDTPVTGVHREKPQEVVVQEKPKKKKIKKMKAKFLRESMDQTRMLAEPKKPWYKRALGWVAAHPVKTILIGLGAGLGIGLIGTGISLAAAGGLTAAAASGTTSGIFGTVGAFLNHAYVPMMASAISGGIVGVGALGASALPINRLARKSKLYTRFQEQYAQCQKLEKTVGTYITKEEYHKQKLSTTRQQIRENKGLLKTPKRLALKASRLYHKWRKKEDRKKKREKMAVYRQTARQAIDTKYALNNEELTSGKTMSMAGYSQKKRKAQQRLAEGKIDKEEYADELEDLSESVADLEGGSEGFEQLSDNFMTFDTEALELAGKLGDSEAMRNIVQDIQTRNSTKKVAVEEAEWIDPKAVQKEIARLLGTGKKQDAQRAKELEAYIRKQIQDRENYKRYREAQGLEDDGAVEEYEIEVDVDEKTK